MVLLLTAPERLQINALLKRRTDPEAGAVDEGEWHRQITEALDELHEADIADIIEQLPIEERAILWGVLSPVQIGEVLREVSDQLCDQLIEITQTEDMVEALRLLDADDVAGLMRELPKSHAARLMRLAGLADNSEVRASLSFAEGTVGELMDFLPVLAREDESVGDICGRLRTVAALPSHCDKLFVVDKWERLSGVLPLKLLLINPPESLAGDVMVAENLHVFDTDDSVEEATSAFERYDLISAPVLNDQRKVIGRITIDELFDELHQARSRELLNSAGVQEEEDLFAPVLHRFGNRWRWLFINLVAAFLISRVVGLFEGTIVQLVALASLMPIVAGMSGNIGNQTATLTVRALALGQINRGNWNQIVRNEALTSILNGVVWGGLVAIFAYALYGRLDLAVVLVLAMTLCFLSGATAGFAVPILMQRMGRDPALGTTVVISAITDTLGFLIFLGTAALFLI